MSNVYFKKMDVLNDGVNEVVYELLSKVIKDENVKFEDIVPLKVHFGEMGNETFIKPEYFNGIKRYLNEQHIDSCYMDTNVLYKGSRTETNDHIKTALDHGFTDLPIIIADGDDENMYEEVLVNLKHFKSCKIGDKYKNYNNFIVVSHFKGHQMAGFGGAIKQLAMGFASRGGKLAQHSMSVPIINESKCVMCGACFRKCPVNAILMKPKASIMEDKCIGCASCQTVCKFNAISNTWDSSYFHEKLAEYAYAATIGKKNIYIQYAFNITADCDCHGDKLPIIANNIGVLISTDPVAIDKATYDIFKKDNHDVFSTANITLNYASKIGLGELAYQLIEI